MIEFDYNLDYKNLHFKPNDRRYRIGRGEQGVLLVRPYTNDICKYWRFKTPSIAERSAKQIFIEYKKYRKNKDFVGMDMCRKFLEMGFTRARRYANHRNGNKYNKDGTIKPQESDAMTCHFAKSATIFREYRLLVANDSLYKTMRKEWRRTEPEQITNGKRYGP